MNTNVDVDAMRKDAVEIFQKGFACSESVIYAIKKGFDLDLSDDAIAMRWWLYLWCACRSNHVHRLFFRKKNTWR